MHLAELERRVALALGGSDFVLVVPPFAAKELPSIALHLLQACAARAGFEVGVFYASLAFASWIGEDYYESLSDGAGLPGERLFAHAAYGHAVEVLFPDDMGVYVCGQPARPGPPVDIAAMRRFAGRAAVFAAVVGRQLAGRGYRVVGCSTTFEQTAASIAILNAVKRLSPGTVTIIGGANCEGEMAEGMAALAGCADHVFSGEAEATFPAFLSSLAAGEERPGRIVRATAGASMADLPLPEFGEYFEQLALFLPDGLARNLGEVWLPYESSRGCWWGEVSQCTFCGLNGANMVQRSKASDTVYDELSVLISKYPTKNVFAVDNIMPRTFFKTLLPRLPGLDGLNLFYEQKSNLSRGDLLAMKRGGINLIQPGIESLSTGLLKLMKKGVTARHHVRLLRDAREVGVSLNWNLLYGFPGDKPEYYAEMLALIPHLVHLGPPLKLLGLSLDRFSPYYEQPAEHGVSGLRPSVSYGQILPEGVPIEKIAYHFRGEYETVARSDPALIAALDSEVERWKALWQSGTGAPVLSAAPLNDEVWVLVDSRYGGAARYEFMDRAARDYLSVERRVKDFDADGFGWAVARHLVCEVDGFYVPLVWFKEPRTLGGRHE